MSNVNRPRRGLLDGLADIVADLYGESAKAAEDTSPTPAVSEPAAAEPVLPPFEHLWKTADEAVDWTEALASPAPTDSLTDPDKWQLYHSHAAAVLRGDLTAYRAVLEAANPVADLAPYVTALEASVESADQLRAVFSLRPELMADDARHALSAVALRIARDLFALLPVSAVAVEAHGEGTPLLTVSFERHELYKVRFAFIDPVAFVMGCGGEFTI